MTELSEETLANLRATSTATLTTQLFRRGIRSAFVQGVRPLGPYRDKLIGPAFTLRYIPAREDIDAFGAKPDPNDLQREALEAVPRGHVLVMDCRGDTRAASAGDIYIARLAVKGVAGVVSDGAVRDSEQIGRMNFPVFCAGPSRRPTGSCITPRITICRSVAAASPSTPATLSSATATAWPSSRGAWSTRSPPTPPSRNGLSRISSAVSRWASRCRGFIRSITRRGPPTRPGARNKRPRAT